MNVTLRCFLRPNAGRPAGACAREKCRIDKINRQAGGGGGGRTLQFLIDEAVRGEPINRLVCPFFATRVFARNIVGGKFGDRKLTRSLLINHCSKPVSVSDKTRIFHVRTSRWLNISRTLVVGGKPRAIADRNVRKTDEFSDERR